MPFVNVSVNSRCLTLESKETTESWALSASGVCISPRGWTQTFRIEYQGQVYEGLGADVLVRINERPSRAEEAGIPTDASYNPDDEYRDVLRVDFPDDKHSRPYFQLTLSLPSEAFWRAADADMTRNEIVLSIENELIGQPLIYGVDPDGRDIEWHADKAQHVFIRCVTLQIQSKIDSSTSSHLQQDVSARNNLATASDSTMLIQSINLLNLKADAISTTIKTSTRMLAIVLVIVALILGFR